jgi:glutathione synthase/RimK-type ligase-like ATP-grasp enzyme
VVVDLSWFPKDMRMHAMIAPDVNAMALDLPGGRRLDLDNVGAVWHRRIRPFELDPALTDETARSFAWSEATDALPGLWHGMDCFWMNPPDTDERAMKKVYQHRLAAQLGLRVPETLVTNDPEAARAFVEPRMARGVVRKAFRNHPAAPRLTLKIGPAELARIDSVRFAPVIFQEFIPAGLDLRATVIDGEIFTASFRSAPEYEVDYRAGIGTAEVTPYTLPEDLADRLRALMQRLGLAFGAVDFRVTPEGEHVFFEINPAGEFLFVSDRVDLAIPQAIAATLESHDIAHGQG